MTSYLPYGFRCLQHFHAFYARHLTAERSDHVSLTQSQLGDKRYDAVPTSPSVTAFLPSEVVERTTVVPPPPPTVTCNSSSTTLATASPPAEAVGAVSDNSAEYAYRLRRPTDDVVLYHSEWLSGTPHPTWRWLPRDVLDTHGCERIFTIELCVRPSARSGTKDRPHNVGVIVLQSIPLSTNTGSALEYVAATVAEADMMNEDEGSSSSSPLLLALCVDGVYALRSLDYHNCKRPAAVAAALPGRVVAWSASPGGVGQYAVSHDTCNGSASSEPTTLGDLKTLTVATVAWQHLLTLHVERCGAQRQRIDAAAVTQRSAAEKEAATAVLQVRLAALREDLTYATLELEQWRDSVRTQQNVLEEQEQAFRLLDRRFSHSSETEMGQWTREEELHRASVRARLVRRRQELTRDLAHSFPISMSKHYGVSSASLPLRSCKDTIAGATLPVLGNAAFGLAVSKAEDYFEEALALGHAAHVVQTLATLQNCVLPHPLLVAGARSSILPQPGATPVEVVGSDSRLPLSCQRASGYPSMLAAVNLLLRNCRHVVRAMGKEEEMLEACGLRLGAVLEYLLTDT